MNDPLANAYLKVITEATDDLQKTGVAKTDLDIGSAFGHKENDKNSKNFISKSGPEETDAEDAEEAPAELSVSGRDGSLKKDTVSYESKNPFDRLYNKILLDENIGAEPFEADFSSGNPAEGEESSFGASEGDDHEDLGSGDDDSDFSSDNEEGDKVTISIDRETAEKLVEVLNGVLGGEDEEGEDEGPDDSSFDSSDDTDEEEGKGEEHSELEEESVDAEVQGHALVDQEKLQHGLNSKGNYTVKGAVPVTKKSAQTPSTGKGFDGKLKSHSTQSAISKLTSKKNDVGGVKVGKTLFDND
jgi:hypothetical protein